MTNMHGHRSARSRRLIAFIMVLALNLTIVAGALAAELVNGEFEVTVLGHRFCSTSGWQTSGSVGANTEDAYGLVDGSSDCVARVHSSSDAGAVSTLSQSFTVANSHLGLSLMPQSFLANAGSQTVTIYDASGNVIYTKSNNYNGGRYFLCQNVGAYSGQTITLEVKTSLTKSYLAERYSTLFVDSAHFAPGCIWPNNYSGW